MAKYPAARDAALVRSGKVLSGAQIAEQRRDAEIAWAAYRRRGESPEAYAAYEAAYRDHWARYGHTLSSIAVQVYLHGYDGAPRDVEPLIAYLERDFREPHSYYTKKKVVQHLEDAMLPEDICARLQRLVLDAVDGQKHSEFNGYGGLAKAVNTPAFRGSLHDRLKSKHGSIRRRARIMLQQLDTRANLPSRSERQSVSWAMTKKWQRLEHRWDTRQRAERDKQVVQAEVAWAEAQTAEQQRDSAETWAARSRRLESPEAYAEYEETQRRFGAKYGHSQASVAFWQVYQRMIDRKPVDAEPFIDYLERDAWEFRSGYTKARVIQFLKSADLSESERARLRKVAFRR